MNKQQAADLAAALQQEADVEEMSRQYEPRQAANCDAWAVKETDGNTGLVIQIWTNPTVSFPV